MTQVRTNTSRLGGHPICKACGRSDKFDFNVPDRLWGKIVPTKYRNQVVCLECFDEFAFEKGVDYSGSIEILYFAGNQATFTFQTVAARGA
jgi:hypothetical protein